MKKSVIVMLTGALIVGTTVNAFAAANPFSDVPAGHWAYNSVTKLAQEGIIEGYGDGTYLGNRNITRYEMAQMIAKAMAKNPQGASKAELDRLAAEFREELDNLGVRVSELEKHADKVQWGGKIEYTYHNLKGRGSLDGNKYKSNGYIFRLEPVAEINDHWTARARLDAEGDMKFDSTSHDTELVRLWAQADYDKFQAKLGRFEFYTNEEGLIWDDEISGAQLTFGSKWKGTILAGRLKDDKVGYPGYFDADEENFESEFKSWAINPGDYISGENESDVVGINVQYEDPGDKGLFGGASWYYVKDKDLAVFTKDFNDKANIWGLNIGYRFNDMATLKGAYASNTKADIQKNSWQVEARYGNYEDALEKDQWAIAAGYRKFGLGTSFAGTNDEDILLGYKGWFVSASYAPFKNIGIILKYGDNKMIDNNDIKVRHFFARGEFFF